MNWVSALIQTFTFLLQHAIRFLKVLHEAVIFKFVVCLFKVKAAQEQKPGRTVKQNKTKFTASKSSTKAKASAPTQTLLTQVDFYKTFIVVDVVFFEVDLLFYIGAEQR